LVRRLVDLCDGRRTVSELAAALRRAAGSTAPEESLARIVAQALRILYIDGMITELREPAPGADR
jgi:hypothetical protein